MNQNSVEYNKYIQNETEGMRLKENGKTEMIVYTYMYVYINTIH